MIELIITSVVVLAVIAIIEIVTLFFTLPADDAPPYVTVLPVFHGDNLFESRLEYLMQKTCGRGNIILVDYSADEYQRDLCNRFINNNPDAVFIPYSELESHLSAVFCGNQK